MFVLKLSGLQVILNISAHTLKEKVFTKPEKHYLVFRAFKDTQCII